MASGFGSPVEEENVVSMLNQIEATDSVMRRDCWSTDLEPVTEAKGGLASLDTCVMELG